MDFQILCDRKNLLLVVVIIKNHKNVESVLCLSITGEILSVPNFNLTKKDILISFNTQNVLGVNTSRTVYRTHLFKKKKTMCLSKKLTDLRRIALGPLHCLESVELPVSYIIIQK